MSKTLLDVVQHLLSATSGETVNSIFDTVESEQMARIVQDCYETLLASMDFSDRFGLYELEASGTSTKPVLMSLPSSATTLEWLKYDCRTSSDTSSVMTDLKYVDLETFLSMMYSINTDEQDTESFSTTINNASVEVIYRTDRSPSIFTMYDNSKVLFDSVDTEVEVTLQKTKTLAYGRLDFSFSLTDTFVIPFDESATQLLIQDAKTQAYNELRQMENVISAKKTKELKVVIQKNKSMDGRRASHYSFGRRSIKGGR